MSLFCLYTLSSVPAPTSCQQHRASSPVSYGSELSASASFLNMTNAKEQLKPRHFLRIQLFTFIYVMSATQIIELSALRLNPQ